MLSKGFVMLLLVVLPAGRMYTLIDLTFYILVVIALLGYHELYNHLAFFMQLFFPPLKQMIENEPTCIIIAKEKCSVKDCV